MARGSTWRSLLAGTFATALAIAAVGPSGAGAAVRTDGGATKEGGTLSVGIPGYDFVDPALTPSPNGGGVDQRVFAVSWAVADATCALLLRYPVRPPPAVGYELVPEVAKDYPAMSRDGRTYTFTIRKGYRFSTGAPVTAANYVRAIRRVLSPTMNSPGRDYLQEVAAVEAAGNRLIIRLRKRVPDFPARMTMPYLCPVPIGLPIDPEGVAAPLPGSGRYYLAEFVRGKQVVLKRNPFYRGPRPRHLDRLVAQVVDSTAISQQVEAGALDVDMGVSPSQLSDLSARYGVNKRRLFSVPSGNMFYLVMNTSRPLFRHNPKLRRAVNFALDRSKTLDDFGAAWAGVLTDDYLPPGSPGYLDAKLYPLKRPDLKKARALAEGRTRGGKAVIYACNSILTTCLAHAQTVRDNLAKIGIDVEIKQPPGARVSTRGEPFDLVVIRYNVAWVDPYEYVNRMLDGRTIRATANQNLSYFNSRHYNRLMDEAARLSGSARLNAYGRLAVDIARDAAPMAAMFERTNRIFVSSRVGCVEAGAHSVDLAGLCAR
jgi:ABC-type transport system substrate-binding protein